MGEQRPVIGWVRSLLFRPANSTVTDEEVDYFGDHPDELDEVSAPVTVHLVFL